MAQTLGTAIEPMAPVATPAPSAASFPSQGAADSTARQPRAPAALQPSVAAAPAPAAHAETPPPALQAVIDSINAELLTAGKSLQLSVDSESDRSVVIVRDTATGAVVAQFPTEQVLRLRSLLEAHPHVLVDLTV